MLCTSRSWHISRRISVGRPTKSAAVEDRWAMIRREMFESGKMANFGTKILCCSSVVVDIRNSTQDDSMGKEYSGMSVFHRVIDRQFVKNAH